MISLLAGLATNLNGQSLYPHETGEVVRCNAMIETEKGYISGVCIMQHREDAIVGSLFNEFGVSAIDFIYDIAEDKVELRHVLGMLDRKPIKRTIKKDLRQWLHILWQGNAVYVNIHRGITYTLTPINDKDI